MEKIDCRGYHVEKTFGSLNKLNISLKCLISLKVLNSVCMGVLKKDNLSQLTILIHIVYSHNSHIRFAANLFIIPSTQLHYVL